MSNNLVIQMLLKTGTFSNDLKTAKGQIQNFQNGCKTAGRSLDSFGKGLGINIGSLTKFNGAMAAAAVAGKILKDGLKQNADFMDEFNRKTDTAKAAWSNFTNALVNGGAVSSFKELRKEVREAYDAFDKWNLANKSINIVLSISETKYNRLLEVARDVSLADVDRLEALNEANVIMQKQIDMQRSLASLDKKRSKEALEAELAKKGVTNFNQNTLNGFLEIDENGEWGFEKYLKANENASEKLKKVWKRAGGAYALADALDNIRRGDEKGLKILEDYVKNNIWNYGTDLVDYNEQKMKTEIEKLRKRIQSGADKAKVKVDVEVKEPEEGSLAWYQKLLKEEKENLENMSDTNEKYGEQLKLVQALQHAVDVLQDKMKSLRLPDLQKVSVDLTPKKTSPNKTDKNGLIIKQGSGWDVDNNGNIIRDMSTMNTAVVQTTDTWDNFNTSMSATSTIVSNLANTFSDMSEISVASILNMVATTLPAIGSLIGAFQALTAVKAAEAGVTAVEKGVSTASHWIEAIAAVAALGATVAAAIAAAKKNSKGFANGGIVGGNSYSGDRLTANVNSGEMILNRAQQANLFRQINNGGTSGGHVEFEISGTNLYGVLNNYNKKMSLIR